MASYFTRLTAFGAGVLLTAASCWLAPGPAAAPVTPAEAGVPNPPAANQPDAPVPSNTVRQGFPARGFDPAAPERSDTCWEVEWELTHPENRVYFPPGS